MNRGKRRKAREGKVVAGPRPNYGFRFNENRDGYLVDEDKMVLVRRIFRMVGAEGMTLNATRCALEKEGIPTPSGRRVWSRQYLRDCIHTAKLRAPARGPIHRSAWKGNSANFVLRGFYEVRTALLRSLSKTVL